MTRQRLYRHQTENGWITVSGPVTQYERDLPAEGWRPATRTERIRDWWISPRYSRVYLVVWLALFVVIRVALELVW